MIGKLNVPAALPPEEKPPSTHWIGDWMGSRTCLVDVEKRKFLTIPALELRPLGRPARSQSLYRLLLEIGIKVKQYPGHYHMKRKVLSVNTCFMAVKRKLFALIL
jgi:hypothetical protein